MILKSGTVLHGSPCKLAIETDEPRRTRGISVNSTSTVGGLRSHDVARDRRVERRKEQGCRFEEKRSKN
jgi:hypothetical protein